MHDVLLLLSPLQQDIVSGSVEAFQNAIDKGQKDVLEVIAAAIPESLKACVCKVRAVYVVAIE